MWIGASWRTESNPSTKTALIVQMATVPIKKSTLFAIGKCDKLDSVCYSLSDQLKGRATFAVGKEQKVSINTISCQHWKPSSDITKTLYYQEVAEISQSACGSVRISDFGTTVIGGLPNNIV